MTISLERKWKGRFNCGMQTIPYTLTSWVSNKPGNATSYVGLCQFSYIDKMIIERMYAPILPAAASFQAGASLPVAPMIFLLSS